MRAEIKRVRDWLDEVLPHRAQGHFVGPHLSHYLDDLLIDMGLPTRRTGNAVTEFFGRVSAARYRRLAAENTART